MACLIAPSVLACDLSRLGEEARAVEAAGADWLHVDVMDGHFVPEVSMGPPIVRALRRACHLPLDVHLMVEAPDATLSRYADAGADRLSVHAEACRHLHRTLGRVRELGAHVGVVLNPATPTCAIEHVLDLVDTVLVMLVNPGFGGQTPLPSMWPKVTQLAAIKAQRQLGFTLQVDGGVSEKTLASLAARGAECFVAGTAIFGQNDYARAIRALREAFAEQTKS